MEFNAAHHVGDDSPATVRRRLGTNGKFFDFLKQRIAGARKYAAAGRDYALFRTLYQAGLRSEEQRRWSSPTCTSAVARSGSSMSASARGPTRRAPAALGTDARRTRPDAAVVPG